MEANADQIAEDIADAVKDATEELKAEIARLTAERDQALARAAAAAMEMRERAAEAYEDGFPEWDTFSAAATAIRALPNDPDAQKALDKLLTEAEQRGYANAMGG